MGIKRLKFLQLGEESTKGVEVSATAVWRGVSSIAELAEVVFPDEEIGIIPASDRSYKPKLGAQVLMEETPFTFEQLPYILNAGVDNATGVQDGAGTDYVYTYTFPTTAVKTPVSYTLELGDDTQEEQSLYGMVSSFNISGRIWEAIMMNATWFGRAVNTGTKTAALAAAAVDECMFGQSKLYIDAGGGTIGSTEITDTLQEFALSVNTGVVPIPTDNDLDFSTDGMNEPILSLRLKMLNNATAVAEKAAHLAETTRLIRILAEFPTAVATPGTTYTFKTLQIDLAGKWSSFDPLGDEDGQSVVEGVFDVKYSSADALFAEIIVVNELSALV